MTTRLRPHLARLGLLCLCIGIVGGVGILVSQTLSIRTETAFIFPISIAALACVTAHLGTMCDPPQSSFDLASIAASTGFFVIAAIFIVIIGVLMTALTGGLAAPTYFFLVFLEWVGIYMFWSLQT